MVTLATRPEAKPDVDHSTAADEFGPGTPDPWEAPIPIPYAGSGGRRRKKLAREDASRDRRAVPPLPALSPRRVASAGTASAGRARRVVARVLLGVPAALVLALLVMIALPVLFGGRSLVVMSGSMEPAIPTGSVVVVKQVAAAQIAAGDVVSFRSPEDPGRILTHRVQAVRLDGGRVEVETRGDANTGLESWSIDPGGTVGRVAFHIPVVGYLLAPLQGTAPRLLFVVVPAVLLAGFLLVDIWRPPADGARRRVRLAPSPARGGSA